MYTIIDKVSGVRRKYDTYADVESYVNTIAFCFDDEDLQNKLEVMRYCYTVYCFDFRVPLKEVHEKGLEVAVWDNTEHYDIYSRDPIGSYDTMYEAIEAILTHPTMFDVYPFRNGNNFIGRMWFVEEESGHVDHEPGYGEPFDFEDTGETVYTYILPICDNRVHGQFPRWAHGKSSGYYETI